MCSYVLVCTDNIQTSVAHIWTNLLPEQSEETRSETVVGGVGHQVGQTLTDRAERDNKGQSSGTSLQACFTLRTNKSYFSIFAIDKHKKTT